MFQCLNNDVLIDMMSKFVIAYMDNIAIYLPNLERHVMHVKKALSQLFAYQLYIKAEKWEFYIP